MIPRLGQLNTGSSLSVHWLSKFGLIPGTDSLLMYRRTCRTAAPRVHGKVVRDGEDRFHEEDLGPVTFVPLIGAAGWAEPAVDAAPAFERLWPRRPAVSARAPSATDLIREAAEPLPEPDDPAFGAMFDRFAKARVVLLGYGLFTRGNSQPNSPTAITASVRLVTSNALRIAVT